MEEKKSIRTLQELREAAGSETASRIFTEYLMEMTAKANLLDEVKDLIEKGCSLEDIKELM